MAGHSHNTPFVDGTSATRGGAARSLALAAFKICYACMHGTPSRAMHNKLHCKLLCTAAGVHNKLHIKFGGTNDAFAQPVGRESRAFSVLYSFFSCPLATSLGGKTKNGFNGPRPSPKTRS